MFSDLATLNTVLDSTSQPDEAGDRDSGEDSVGGQKLAFFLLALLVVGTGVLGYRLYPETHRQSANPSFVDNIFASNLVIFIARVILLLGACMLAAGMYFVVISIWKRAKAGHYLTRFGPFETQAVEDLRGEVETWQEYWAEENRKVVELNDRIEVSDNLIAKLQDELREARGSDATMRESS